MGNRKEPIDHNEEFLDPLDEAMEEMGIDKNSEQSPEDQIRNKINELVVDPSEYGMSELRINQLKTIFNHKGLPRDDLKLLVFPHLQDLEVSGFKPAEIAAAIGVSATTIYKWRKQIKKSIKEHALSFDPVEAFGRMLLYRDKVLNRCEKEYNLSADPDQKHKFMSLGLKTSESQLNLISEVGLFKDIANKVNEEIDETKQDQIDVSNDLDTILGLLATGTENKRIPTSEEDSG